jgi:hypothetical protein
MILLHLFQCPNEIGYAGYTYVLGRSGGGLGYSTGYRGGPPLRQNDPIYTSPVRRTKDSAKVMRVFDPIQGEKKSVLVALPWDQQVFNTQEFPLFHYGQYALVGICSG